MTIDYAALAQSGVAAWKRGDARAAQAAFARIEEDGRGTHQLRLLLAQASVAVDDQPVAIRALDRVLGEEPTNLHALILRGDLHTRADDPRAAVSWYQAALAQAPRAGALSPDLVAALDRGRAAVAAASGAFEAHLDRATRDCRAAAGARFDEALQILTGRNEPFLQQPTSFYYPGLPARPFFDPADFAWVAQVEAAAPAISEEVSAILADEEALSPYVVAQADRPNKRHALLDDPAWSAFHLLRDGQEVPANVARCPATMAALAAIPIPWIARRSPMALLSVLRAGTHIPPHTGMLNTRLICHLPLIVPQGCRLRVGNIERTVEPGRMMIFDDSIEHEAWNDSDAVRVVLLFEIWHPALTEAERTALTALYEAISDYGPQQQATAGA